MGEGGVAFEVDDECFPSPPSTAMSCMKVVCFYTSVCVCVCIGRHRCPLQAAGAGLGAEQ